MMNAGSRPDSLETRMATIGHLLLRFGFDLSTTIFHAMCWWEESLSPLITEEQVANLDWKITQDGPRAGMVDQILDKWKRSGSIKPWPESPIAYEQLQIDESLIEVGVLVSGLQSHELMRSSPSQHLPWYAMVEGFIDGFYSEQGPRVSSWSTQDDIIYMLRVDPVFTRDPWIAAGGPGRVDKKCKIRDEDQIFEARGNQNTTLMQWYKNHPNGRYNNNYSAAWMVSHHIVVKADETFPLFADKQFLANRERLKFTETNNDGKVDAEFFFDGQLVARASWQTAKREVVNHGTKDTWTQVLDDHLLTNLEVVVGRRKGGIGTYVMRHALTQGCTRSLPPPEQFANLWKKHGWPENEGEWKLARSGWPTCQPYQKPSNIIQFPSIRR